MISGAKPMDFRLLYSSMNFRTCHITWWVNIEWLGWEKNCKMSWLHKAGLWSTCVSLSSVAVTASKAMTTASRSWFNWVYRYTSAGTPGSSTSTLLALWLSVEKSRKTWCSKSKAWLNSVLGILPVSELIMTCKIRPAVLFVLRWIIELAVLLHFPPVTYRRGYTDFLCDLYTQYR